MILIPQSSQTQSRRLAAILFADIKDYSVVMQQDEASALILIQKFNTVIHNHLDTYQGELMHFRGDGCMIIFDSVIHSVQFALQIQKEFTQELRVPVRVGLHKGDVVFKKGSAYGDSVNIAARIESLAQANSIYVSKSIRDQLTNQNIDLVSIGAHTLKNIEAPIELFAIQNDFLAFTAPTITPKKKFNLQMAMLIIVMAIITGWIIIGGYLHGGPLNAEIPLAEKTVAIKIFENKTNHAELDNFGPFAADFISTSLMKVHSRIINESDTQRKFYMSSFVNSGTSQLALNEMKADVMIEGRYYIEGNQLIISSFLKEPHSGKIIHSFPQIKNELTAKSEIVSELSEFILGYWSVIDGDLLSHKPPKYKAHKHYMKAMEAHNRNDTLTTESNLLAAINIDSTFYDALFTLGHFYFSYKKYVDLDSLVLSISKRNYDFDTYEQLKFDALKAVHAGNLEEEAYLYQQIAKINPYAANFRTANALYKINKPSAALSFIEKELDNLKFRGSPLHQKILGTKLFCLHELDQHQQIIETVDNLDFAITTGSIPISYAQALCALEKLDKIEMLSEKFNASQYVRKFPILIDFNSCYKLYMMDMEEAGVYCKNTFDKYSPEKRREYNSLLARIHFMEKDFAASIPLLEDANDGDLNGELMYSFNKIGEYKKADLIKSTIEESLQNVNISLNAKALYNYELASYHVGLGDYEAALTFLKEAHRLGLGFSWIHYDNDIRMKEMREYKPFADFVKPKS